MTIFFVICFPTRCSSTVFTRAVIFSPAEARPGLGRRLEDARLRQSSPEQQENSAAAAMNNVKKAGGRCASFRVTNPNLREFLAECAGREAWLGLKGY